MTSTAGRPAPPAFDSASTSLSSFRGCSMAEVRRIIMSSPIKSCTLDPMSTFLVRQHVDLLLPYVTTMINSSLTQGRLPESQKHRLWRHCYKTGPGTSSMANFRPVSNLSFMSKVVEKVVSQQLNEHLTDQALLPRHQSTYRKYHSTETAMLRVMLDALTVADQRRVTLIGLLDLSSAFDCVDHSLLLQRLERTFGLSGMILRWLTSYFTDRSQQVTYCGQLSPTLSVQFGVSQEVCFRPSAIRSVHGRPQSSGGKSRLHPASVCWRLSNLHQHASWRCCGGGRPIFPLSWRR